MYLTPIKDTESILEITIFLGIHPTLAIVMIPRYRYLLAEALTNSV